MANVIMQNGNTTRMFTVYSDGTYVEMVAGQNLKIEDDFAAEYIQLRENGWKEM